MSEPLIKSIKIVFNPNHWPWAANFDGKIGGSRSMKIDEFLASFGPEMKVQRSKERAKFIGIHLKVVNNVWTTYRIDQNYF